MIKVSNDNNSAIKSGKSGNNVNSGKDIKQGAKVSSGGDQEITSNVEDSFRPRRFDEIIGRSQEKKTLQMMIDSAKKRKSVVDHILFYGPPGLGKTTFAMSISNEIGSSLLITSGPAIERQGDLAAILTNLKKGDVLFIDEIHRLSRGIEEILYPAMEDGVLDIVMGKGPSAKTIRLNLEPFTMVGATTQIGKISAPMRDRFGLVQRLDYFSDEDLGEIIKRAAKLEGVEIDDEAVAEMAKRARGTGRVALRLFKRARDYYEAVPSSSGGSRGSAIGIGKDTVLKTLELLGVDQLGLEEIDRKILAIIMSHFDGGPVGISTLAAAISEDVETLSSVHEPFLLKQGLLKRTSRGRVLTKKGIMLINDSQYNLSL